MEFHKNVSDSLLVAALPLMAIFLRKQPVFMATDKDAPEQRKLKKRNRIERTICTMSMADELNDFAKLYAVFTPETKQKQSATKRTIGNRHRHATERVRVCTIEFLPLRQLLSCFLHFFSLLSFSSIHFFSSLSFCFLAIFGWPFVLSGFRCSVLFARV